VKSGSLGNLAAASSFLVAICGLLYAVSFVVLKNQTLFSLFLLLGGLLTLVVFVELYERLHRINSAGALLALLLGTIGAAGAMAHGGFDLANALNPPRITPGFNDLPSAVDPRGFAAFGLAGLALLVWSGLLLSSQSTTRGLGSWGLLSGILLLIVYLARLIILDASNPVVLLPALLEGFIVNPVWYLWLGGSLARPWPR
jgi:hypothetical protein